MVENGVQGVEFVSINTDMQALNYSQASSASQIGAFLLQAQAGGSELPEMPDVFTKLRPREGWVPVICVVSPLLCLLLSLNSESWLGG